MPNSSNNLYKTTLSDKVIGSICTSILILMWIYTLFIYGILPDSIPIHLNFKGEIDKLGSKVTIFIFPILGTIFYFGLSAIKNKTKYFNYPVKITEKNKLFHETAARNLLRNIKLASLIIFFLCSIEMAQVAIYGKFDFLFLLPISSILIIFLPILFYLIKVFNHPNK